MAIDEGPAPGDPETSAAALGLDRDPVPAHAELAADLDARVAGEVAFDEYTQVLYATDGSVYSARPAGVVCPRDAEDVVTAVEVATDHDAPVLPRGAGSSLAGQAVGPGCVVLDLSRHMDAIREIRPDEQRAVVQPGVVQDDLDDALADHGLKFAPDPASSGRATIGGGIGNNSTGAHSVRYGITDAYVESVEAVLASGERIRTREVVVDSPEWDRLVEGDGAEARIYRAVREIVEENESEIANRYPDLKRSVTGYNLQKVAAETDDGRTVIDLTPLFVGAEGTLGVVIEAELSLVTVPDETAIALYCFDDLIDALRAVPKALEHPVSAVELMDEEVFRLAAESDGYAEYAEVIPPGTAAALMVEFDSELVDDFESAIADTNDRFLRTPVDSRERDDGGDSEDDRGDPGRVDSNGDNGDAFDVVEAYAEGAQADLWKLRKAAIPLLMSLEGDPKPYPFIEDATVPPAELAEYVQGFQRILETHDTSAAYFAHAGSGTLHIRPILNLKERDGIDRMHSITDDVTDLVLEHHGAFSGEHGDGMARTEFTPKMYGPALWDAFKRLKTAFDPEWLLHPGNVVYRESADDPGPNSERGVGADMRSHLRYGEEYRSVDPETTLDFDDEGGFSHLVELCNGCGTCRQTGEDVMCPTYRASREEIQTTRGRANLLRAAISGELPREEIHSDRFQREVLDLCVGCKGCGSDCPTGVDLAKLKAEVKHQHHQQEGAGLRERLFRDVDRIAALGSRLAPLSNAATTLPGSGVLAEKFVGIARDRTLPAFRRTTFRDWFEGREEGGVPPEYATDRVVLLPDTYTQYSDPAPGRAAVSVLEAADVHVRLPEDHLPSGRAAFSTGFLATARDRAERVVDDVAPLVEQGYSVVAVEPSDAVMLQDEYRDLLDGRDVDHVAGATYGTCEYLDLTNALADVPTDARDGPGPNRGTLTYHGHCNQKAVGTDHHAANVLRSVGYEVDALDSSCCGMAGSFGYEAEHYDLSRAIGRILFDQVDDSDGDRVVAPGVSCRTQLGDREDGDRPPHPIEEVAAALSDAHD